MLAISPEYLLAAARQALVAVKLTEQAPRI